MVIYDLIVICKIENVGGKFITGPILKPYTSRILSLRMNSSQLSSWVNRAVIPVCHQQWTLRKKLQIYVPNVFARNWAKYWVEVPPVYSAFTRTVSRGIDGSQAGPGSHRHRQGQRRSPNVDRHSWLVQL